MKEDIFYCAKVTESLSLQYQNKPIRISNSKVNRKRLL